jgi:hypothetical protein
MWSVIVTVQRYVDAVLSSTYKAESLMIAQAIAGKFTRSVLEKTNVFPTIDLLPMRDSLSSGMSLSM